MNIFEHKLRVLHTRSIQRIMNNPVSTSNQRRTPKMMKTKGQNITTYMRKVFSYDNQFDIERQNLNLAKRIMQCESSHNKQKYARQWKKNKNYMRVRSNFKPNLATEQPKIIKYQPIVGRGTYLVQISIRDIRSNNNNNFQNTINDKHIYSIKAYIGKHQIQTSNRLFTLQSVKKKGDHCVSFYIPGFLKKRQISCRLSQVIQNQTYQKGRFIIGSLSKQVQQIQVMNKSGKSFGRILLVAQGINIKQLAKEKQNYSTIQYSLA